MAGVCLNLQLVVPCAKNKQENASCPELQVEQETCLIYVSHEVRLKETRDVNLRSS